MTPFLDHFCDHNDTKYVHLLCVRIRTRPKYTYKIRVFGHVHIPVCTYMVQHTIHMHMVQKWVKKACHIFDHFVSKKCEL